LRRNCEGREDIAAWSTPPCDIRADGAFIAFDPGIIQNVRPGAGWKLVWQGAPDFTIEGL
jgi:hypothetical protein